MVNIVFNWDDDPNVAGRSVEEISILDTSWEITASKKGTIKKEILLPAGFKVEGKVYDVNGCLLYTLSGPEKEQTEIRKGQSGGIIKPGVIVDPEDLKNLQDILKDDPDFDLSVIGVQNNDGDSILNPFTGESASQGSGQTNSSNTDEPKSP